MGVCSTANLDMTSGGLALASMQTYDKIGKGKVTTTHLVNKNFWMLKNKIAFFHQQVMSSTRNVELVININTVKRKL